MENSLDEALASLTGGPSPLIARPTDGEETTPGRPAPTPGTGRFQSEIDGFAEAIEGLRENISTLEEALERLKELTGGE